MKFLCDSKFGIKFESIDSIIYSFLSSLYIWKNGNIGNSFMNTCMNTFTPREKQKVSGW